MVRCIFKNSQADSLGSQCRGAFMMSLSLLVVLSLLLTLVDRPVALINVTPKPETP